MTALRTPVCASFAAQMTPSDIAMADPGCGVGYRLSFVMDDGNQVDPIDTHLPVMTAQDGIALGKAANRAVVNLIGICRERVR